MIIYTINDSGDPYSYTVPANCYYAIINYYSWGLRLLDQSNTEVFYAGIYRGDRPAFTNNVTVSLPYNINSIVN